MRVLTPASVEEACGLLAQEPGAAPIAGATDLLVHWPENLGAHERTYVDLSGLSNLRYIRWTDRTLTLGALTTYWDVIGDARAAAEFPLLARAARQVGAIQIQSRGTWAGNIVNGSPAADGVPVLMAYDAVVVLASSRGQERVELSEFYSGYKQMALASDQLVTAIEIPRRAYSFAAFEKVGPRRAQAITKVGLAISRRAEEGPGGWRVVANSVAPTVRRCRAVEALLDAGSPVRCAGDFLAAARQDISPIDDIRSTAEYRETVFTRLLYHCLRGVCPSVA